jgi:chromosome segregation ATPase
MNMSIDAAGDMIDKIAEERNQLKIEIKRWRARLSEAVTRERAALADLDNLEHDYESLEAERDALREQTLRLGDANKRLWAALQAIYKPCDKAVADYRKDRYSFPANDALKDAAINAYNVSRAALRGEGATDV